MTKIGFVGLGQMGSAMCPHLIKDGHHVTVYDVSQKAVSALEKQGAKGTNHQKRRHKAVRRFLLFYLLAKLWRKLFSAQMESRMECLVMQYLSI